MTKLYYLLKKKKIAGKVLNYCLLIAAGVPAFGKDLYSASIRMTSFFMVWSTWCHTREPTDSTYCCCVWNSESCGNALVLKQAQLKYKRKIH